MNTHKKPSGLEHSDSFPASIPDGCFRAWDQLKVWPRSRWFP